MTLQHQKSECSFLILQFCRLNFRFFSIQSLNFASLGFPEEELLRQIMASNMRAMLLTSPSSVHPTNSDISLTNDVINPAFDVTNPTTDVISSYEGVNEFSREGLPKSNGSVGYPNGNGVISAVYDVSDPRCDVRKASERWRKV